VPRVKRRRATMIAVARLADVSVGTVFNVVNNTAAVRPATRKKVEAAIRALSLEPELAGENRFARRRVSPHRFQLPVPLNLRLCFRHMQGKQSC
jgi:hypothetical protein